MKVIKIGLLVAGALTIGFIMANGGPQDVSFGEYVKELLRGLAENPDMIKDMVK